MALQGRRVVPRVSDVYAAVPSITGKLELEYEGELQGETPSPGPYSAVRRDGVLGRTDGWADLGKIVAWFDQGGALKVRVTSAPTCCLKVSVWCRDCSSWWPSSAGRHSKDAPRQVAACELVLEGLAAQKRISRSESWAIPGPSRNAGTGIRKGRNFVG